MHGHDVHVHTHHLLANHSVVHLDVKPANFVYFQLGRIKLIDLGVSQRLRAGERAERGEADKPGGRRRSGRPFSPSPPVQRRREDTHRFSSLNSI